MSVRRAGNSDIRVVISCNTDGDITEILQSHVAEIVHSGMQAEPETLLEHSQRGLIDHFAIVFGSEQDVAEAFAGDRIPCSTSTRLPAETVAIDCLRGVRIIH